MPSAYDFVVVANRLPVDRVTSSSGEPTWRTSPGGLVSALQPVMVSADGAWVGWTGAVDDTPAPFTEAGMHLFPVKLSRDDVTGFYEGFANGTLWPLFHDVIVPPSYHREWWNKYQQVNRRFAEAAAEAAAYEATVWIQDYQLLLVPHLLRKMRPDVRIGFFNHIPFPPIGLFAQLPWRVEVLRGILGADLVGFQRKRDATNFMGSVKQLIGPEINGDIITVADSDETSRQVRASAFPISIEVNRLAEMANSDQTLSRMQEFAQQFGDRRMLLGVDRLDYTKGIRHRLKAFDELLNEGRISPDDIALVQVAPPSRERVSHYRKLRDEIDRIVGRINGTHPSLGNQAVTYMHMTVPRKDMVALFQLADVMLVTALRDGMNLVAKEYVTCRRDGLGTLILSEFAGAADELTESLLVNPHDIEGLKDSIELALTMSHAEQQRRMTAMREQVAQYDVHRWADNFLSSLAARDTIIIR